MNEQVDCTSYCGPAEDGILCNECTRAMELSKMKRSKLSDLFVYRQSGGQVITTMTDEQDLSSEKRRKSMTSTEFEDDLTRVFGILSKLLVVIQESNQKQLFPLLQPPQVKDIRNELLNAMGSIEDSLATICISPYVEED